MLGAKAPFCEVKGAEAPQTAGSPAVSLPHPGCECTHEPFLHPIPPCLHNIHAPRFEWNVGCHGGMDQPWPGRGYDHRFSDRPTNARHAPERFERKADFLGSLDYRNNAAIHGLEEAGGTRLLIRAPSQYPAKIT